MLDGLYKADPSERRKPSRWATDIVILRCLARSGWVVSDDERTARRVATVGFSRANVAGY